MQEIACVAVVKKGRGRGNLGAQEFHFPFDRLPRRLARKVHVVHALQLILVTLEQALHLERLNLRYGKQ